MNVDEHTKRVVQNWLVGRTFQVKMVTTRGTYHSSIRGITRGLPQGGVPSPLLWLIFFNPIAKRLREERLKNPGITAEHGDYIYADDITMVISAKTLEELRSEAAKNIRALRLILSELSLELSDEKTRNLVFHPNLLPNGIHRRMPDLKYPNTKQRTEQQLRAVAAMLIETLDFDPYLPRQEEELNFWEGFPFPVTQTMRILGVTIDPFFALDEHYKDIVTKARLRQGILGKVAGTKWGLEVGVLKMTHDAVIISLLRYALVVTGSCLPPDLMRRLNTQVVNVAARKIGGLSRSTRIESLHFSVGTTTVYNLYVKHCAEFLDASLRANNSSIGKRLREELLRYYNVPSFEIQDVQIAIPEERLKDALGVEKLPKKWQNTYWFCRQLKHQPQLKDWYEANSMYVSNAEEVNKSAFYRLWTYSFKATHSWIDTALQVLQRIRWSPECSGYHDLNIEKLLPPAYTKNHLHIRGDNNPWKALYAEEQLDKKEGQTIYVEAGVATIDQLGATICLITTDRRVLYRGLFIHGRLITGEIPAFLQEAAVLHALRVMHSWMMNNRDQRLQPQNIRMKAGSSEVISALAGWYVHGDLRLQSQVASAIAEDLDKLEHWLRQDLWLEEYRPVTQLGDVATLPWRGKEIMCVIEEFRTHAVPQLGTKWMKELPLIPLTKMEVKDLIATQQREDELLAIRQLGELDSVSAAVILKLNLTREIIASALSRLRMRHEEQVNLLSILCGTRFKYYFQGMLVPTWCPNTFRGEVCAKNDSFNHLVHCYGLRKHLKTGPDAIDFLVMMAKRTKPPNPRRPRPRYIEPPISRNKTRGNGGEGENTGTQGH